MKRIALVVFSLFFACSAFASEDEGLVDIHGFVSQGYLQSDDHNYYFAKTRQGTFEFNEVGLNFSTDLAENFRVGMQLFAKDLGDIGNDEVTIDWAYADYRYRNWIGLRVGKIKKPLGLYNQVRDIDSTRTCIFLPPSIYNEINRESSMASKGVGLYGALPGRLEYQVVYGVFEVSENGGVAKTIENNFNRRAAVPLTSTVNSTEVKNSPDLSLVWRAPLEGLRIGGSYSYYELNMDLTNDYVFVKTPAYFELEGTYSIASVEYSFENLVFSAEYKWTESKTRFKQPENLIPEIDVTEKTEPEDYYVMLTYRFTDWFELGTYYSVHYGDGNDKDGEKLNTDGTPIYQTRYEAWLKDLALSTRFDIGDSWVFKLEGHYMDGLADVDYWSDSKNDDPKDPNADPDNVDPAPNWFLFAAKMSYSF